jgi:hypothetical protein
VLSLGKVSDVRGLKTSWWYIYCLFVLLKSLLNRDAAELEEVSFWKSDKILPPIVLFSFQASGADCMYTARCVGQFVPVDGRV